MKKPINAVALTFWIVAAIFIVGDIPLAIAIRSFAKMAAENGSIPKEDWKSVADTITLVNVWSETRSAFLGGGQLAGVGVLIELVDQIRWNNLPAERQVARHPVREAIGRLRRWPSR